ELPSPTGASRRSRRGYPETVRNQPTQPIEAHWGNGDPDRNRTCDLQIRNLPLYPTELRDHDGAHIAFSALFANLFGANPFGGRSLLSLPASAPQAPLRSP